MARLGFMSCCLLESWKRVRSQRQNLKKFLRELKGGDITFHRSLPFYPRKIRELRQGVYLVPWPLVRVGKRWLYDLEQWDEEWWEYFREFYALFAKAGIYPIISLFDYCHTFVTSDKARSPFYMNKQQVDVLNPHGSGFKFLRKFIQRQVDEIRQMGIWEQTYFEIGNELFRERNCKEGDKRRWCGHELVKKIGDFLIKDLEVPWRRIIVPTGFKGGDYLHNSAALARMKGAWPVHNEIIPDMHLGYLYRRYNPGQEIWEREKEWRNFLKAWQRYMFSTDGIGGGKKTKPHTDWLNWAIRQVKEIGGRGDNAIGFLEIQPGWLWESECPDKQWGCIGEIPHGYFRKIKDGLNTLIQKNFSDLQEAFDFLERGYREAPPPPPPMPSRKSFWQKVWEFIKKLLGL